MRLLPPPRLRLRPGNWPRGYGPIGLIVLDAYALLTFSMRAVFNVCFVRTPPYAGIVFIQPLTP